ncbi:bifunctional DedA family/phosphatase PAP2 family protein [Halochromatium glycolicum]|uniref:Membrane-associated protein n=1 Tax=Halochromatium glycolicum TaxID=85075 RepID=A0AAJ0U0E6_9GAMM|nr:bifunctional DedA family/phosphatase PAP2 family protein [Halochromatium glycolicum]MBK1703091.1 membrane-associated protein [Halochromatium glycolicum]
MHELLESLLTWIGANPKSAYLVVFSAALAESLAVVGMVVPGVMILFGAGALIAAGKIGFWPTAGAAVLGAVLGDGLSYWLGHRYGDRLRDCWPLNRYPRQLERGIAFFARYGGKSVAFGRFFGPGRAIIPLVAGMMQMRPSRFIVANLGSAAAWGPAYLAPGIVFGASLKLAAEAAARLAILLLILIGFIWLVAWLARRLYLLLSPHASAWVQALLHWANLHPVLGRTAQALADPDHPDAATLAALAVALIGASAVLGIAVSAEIAGPQELVINQMMLDLGQSLHTPLADQMMIALSRLGEPAVTVPLVVAVLVYLAANRQRRALLYWLAALGFPLLATPTLGWLVRVPRPEIGLGLGWPWSFPSAQVLTATVLYGFLALSVARTLEPGWRWLPYAAATVIIAAVTTARLYLGTEWLTDLVGTIALGLAWIAALGLAFHCHTRQPREDAGLMWITIIVATLAVTTATFAQQHSDLARYRPSEVWESLAAARWRARAPIPVATHREDLWRRDQRPFHIQYAGPLDHLRQALNAQGWRSAEMLSWTNAIKLLSPSLPLNALPVVPHVHDGHHDELTMVKDLSDGRRLVLRLWGAHCWIGGSVPLWVGDVTELFKDNVLDLFALPLTKPATEFGNRTLRHDLEEASTIDVEPGTPMLLAPKGSRLLEG